MFFDEAVDMFVSAGSDIQHLSKQRDQMLAIQKKAHAAFIDQYQKDKRSSSSSPVASDVSSEAMSDFALSFNQPSLPYKTYDLPGPSKLSETHLPYQQLPVPDMPAGYEIYRHQEDGWEHLISFN